MYSSRSQLVRTRRFNSTDPSPVSKDSLPLTPLENIKTTNKKDKTFFTDEQESPCTYFNSVHGHRLNFQDPAWVDLADDVKSLKNISATFHQVPVKLKQKVKTRTNPRVECDIKA